MGSEIIRDTRLLHPKFRFAVENLAKDLIRSYETGRTKTRFEVFETFRHPFRQADLLAKGTTKAGMWESAHQYGLAVDFVPVIDAEMAAILSEKKGERVWPGWNWDSEHDWDYLSNRAKTFGLVTPLSWDRPHVQHPLWPQLQRELKNLKLN